MRRTPKVVFWRVNRCLTMNCQDHVAPNGDSLMAGGTQQGMLTETPSVLIEEEEQRLSLPEATMFIVTCSGALWVLLFGVINLFVG